MRARTFVDYLRDPEISAILNKNLNNGQDPDGALTRIFNNFPRTKASLDKLTGSFMEAFNRNELEIWFNLVIANISVDLLDANGRLKPEYIRILDGMTNHKLLEDIKKLPAEKITQNIITSYICECVFAPVTALLTQSVMQNPAQFEGEAGKRLAQSARDFFTMELENLKRDPNPGPGKLQDMAEMKEKIVMINDYLKKPDVMALIPIFAFYMPKEIDVKIRTLLKINTPDAFSRSLLAAHALLNRYLKEHEANYLTETADAYFKRRANASDLALSASQSLASSAVTREQADNLRLAEQLTEMRFNLENLARQNFLKREALAEQQLPVIHAAEERVTRLRKALESYRSFLTDRLHELKPKGEIMHDLENRAVIALTTCDFNAKASPEFAKYMEKYAVCSILLQRLQSSGMPAPERLELFQAELNKAGRENRLGGAVNYIAILNEPEPPVKRKAAKIAFEFNPSAQTSLSLAGTMRSPSPPRFASGRELLEEIHQILKSGHAPSPSTR